MGNISAYGVLAVMAIAMILSVFATYRIARTDLYPRERKVGQVLMIWLLPFVGAIVCLVFLRSDSRTFRADPRDF